MVTNSVALALQTVADEYGIVFGDLSQFVLQNFGGLDLLIDPYTQAGVGVVRVHLNNYWDYGWRQSDAYVTGSLK